MLGRWTPKIIFSAKTDGSQLMPLTDKPRATDVYIADWEES